MITYVESSIFTSPAQTLVNTVNTAGVMGKGLAKTYKAIYPEMFAEYASLCEKGEMAVGRLLLYRTPHKWVLNFPTKRHWRQASRLEDIAAGLETFRQTYAEQGVTSVAFPQLGCGNGGLDWEAQVRPVMEHKLGSLAIDVYIHIPADSTLDREAPGQDELVDWLRGEPRALPFAAFWQDLEAIVADRQAGRWSLHGTGASLLHDASGQLAPIARDGLFALWRRLRSFGFLTPDDVALSLAVPAEPVFALLTTLPYIVPARVAPLPPATEYDAHSTRLILSAPEANGIQLVPPLFPVAVAEPHLQDFEEISAWDESETTRQLALFSTS